jgi:hypothetical protein
MDPVTLVTAVITIGGVGFTAAKFSIALYRAIDDARMFDEDIKRIALNFGSFADVIHITERSLKRVCQQHSTSTVVGWIMEKGLANNLVAVSRDIGGQIEKMTERFERVSQRHGLLSLWRKLCWSQFHKLEIHELHPQMESLKTSLSLVYDALKLEILMAMKDTPEIREEMYVQSDADFFMSARQLRKER